MNILNIFKIFFIIFIATCIYSLLTIFLPNRKDNLSIMTSSVPEYNSRMISLNRDGNTIKYNSVVLPPAYQNKNNFNKINGGALRSDFRGPEMIGYNISQSDQSSGISDFNNALGNPEEGNFQNGSSRNKHNSDNHLVAANIVNNFPKGLIDGLKRKNQPGSTKEMKSDLLSQSDMLTINTNTKQGVGENPGEPDYSAVPIGDELNAMLVILFLFIMIKFVTKLNF